MKAISSNSPEEHDCGDYEDVVLCDGRDHHLWCSKCGNTRCTPCPNAETEPNPETEYLEAD